MDRELKNMKYKKQSQKNINIFVLLILLFTVGLIISYGKGNYFYSGIMEMNEGQHSRDSEDIFILSLSETSRTEAKFKLRVTTPPEFHLLPTQITLTTFDSKRENFALTKSNSQYVCYDSHDAKKDHAGYETAWINGKLDDYSVAEMDLSLIANGRDVSIVTLPLSHICTRFSEDFGNINDKSNFNVPYEN